MSDVIAHSLSVIDDVTSEESLEAFKIICRYLIFLEETIVSNHLYNNYEYLVEEFCRQDNIKGENSQ